MTFEQSIVIAASPEQLFALTQDYTRRLQWDPFLKSAELQDDATTAGVGVRAYCVAHNGIGMETEYVSYNPPRTCAVKMTRGPRLLKRFAGSWRFEEIAPGQTRVGFRYHLQAQPRWLSWLLTPILGWKFARDTRKRLRALKVAVEQRGMLGFRQYDMVRIRQLLRPPTTYNGWISNQRPPKVGEVGSVVEILRNDEVPDSYVVEKSGPDGVTIWLGDFQASELETV